MASLCVGLAACGVDEDGSTVREPASDAGFIPSADAGIPPGDAGVASDLGRPAPPCDPLTGSGCTPGMTCTLVAGPECAPAEANPAPIGASCRPGDCGPGLVCATTSATAAVGRCFQVCDLDTGVGCEALGDEVECRLQIGDPRFGACVALPPPCNPYARQPCESPGQACQPFLRRTGVRELRCREAGPQLAGDPCGPRVGECAAGTACVAEPDGSAATCRRYCELNADCPPPEQCTGEVEEPRFGFCQP